MYPNCPKNAVASTTPGHKQSQGRLLPEHSSVIVDIVETAVEYPLISDCLNTGVEFFGDVKGRLKQCFGYWQSTILVFSQFVLDIIVEGSTLLFKKPPEPCYIKNNRSAEAHCKSDKEVIVQLSHNDCIQSILNFPIVTIHCPL